MKQIDVLGALKPKGLKPKEEKPIEYDHYFINGLAEIRNSTKTIDFNNLTYNSTGDSAPISFNGFKGPLHIFKSISNGDLASEEHATLVISNDQSENLLKIVSSLEYSGLC